MQPNRAWDECHPEGSHSLTRFFLAAAVNGRVLLHGHCFEARPPTAIGTHGPHSASLPPGCVPNSVSHPVFVGRGSAAADRFNSEVSLPLLSTKECKQPSPDIVFYLVRNRSSEFLIDRVPFRLCCPAENAGASRRAGRAP